MYVPETQVKKIMQVAKKKPRQNLTPSLMVIKFPTNGTKFDVLKLPQGQQCQIRDQL